MPSAAVVGGSGVVAAEEAAGAAGAGSDASTSFDVGAESVSDIVALVDSLVDVAG